MKRFEVINPSFGTLMEEEEEEEEKEEKEEEEDVAYWSDC